MTRQGRPSERATTRRRGDWRVTVLGLASVASTLWGCAAAGDGGDGASTVRPDAFPPAASDPAPAEPTPPPPRPDPVPPAPCDDDVLGGVGATIDGQLAAFATDDFARAYAFASEGFRSAVSLEAFEAIVRADYAVLLDLGSHEVVECRTDGLRAAVLVGVIDATGAPSLVSYALVRETDRWHIEGAQRAGLGPPRTTT